MGGGAVTDLIKQESIIILMLLLLVGGQIQDFLSAPNNHPNQCHHNRQQEWYNCIEPESM